MLNPSPKSDICLRHIDRTQKEPCIDPDPVLLHSFSLFHRIWSFLELSQTLPLFLHGDLKSHTFPRSINLLNYRNHLDRGHGCLHNKEYTWVQKTLRFTVGISNSWEMTAVECLRHFRIVLIIRRPWIRILRLNSSSLVMHSRFFAHAEGRSPTGSNTCLSFNAVSCNTWIFQPALINIRIKYNFLNKE